MDNGYNSLNDTNQSRTYTLRMNIYGVVIIAMGLLALFNLVHVVLFILILILVIFLALLTLTLVEGERDELISELAVFSCDLTRARRTVSIINSIRVGRRRASRRGCRG